MCREIAYAGCRSAANQNSGRSFYNGVGRTYASQQIAYNGSRHITDYYSRHTGTGNGSAYMRYGTVEGRAGVHVGEASCWRHISFVFKVN